MQQYGNLIFVVIIIAAFYLLMIRPQQQQARRQAEMIEELAPGTEIMTIGGIYATVVTVEEDRIRVALADGSELEIAKRAVASVVGPAHVEHETDGDGEDEDEAEPPMAGSDGSDG
jgi:preprotein translocase subunit YajC